MNPKCYLPFVCWIMLFAPFSIKGQDTSSWASEKMMAIQKAEENQRLERLSSPEYLYESQVWQSPDQARKEGPFPLWLYICGAILVAGLAGLSFRLYFRHQHRAQKQKIIWNKVATLKGQLGPETDRAFFSSLARDVLEKLDRKSLDHIQLSFHLSSDFRSFQLQFGCKDAAHMAALGAAISNILPIQAGASLHVEKQPEAGLSYFLSFPRPETKAEGTEEEAGASPVPAPLGASVKGADQSFLLKAREVVKERMGDSAFNAEAFREEMGMSKTHFYRKIQDLSQQSPGQFIRHMRLLRARQLLEAGAGNVSEIAYEVGFNNLSYFSRCFRNEFGVLPSEVN